MLLYIMLYITLAYLMLFAALFISVCLYKANLFFAIDFCKCFCFHALSLDYLHISCLSQILFCIMHSAFSISWFS